MNIYNKLLNTGLINDNKYLKLYCDLIENNKLPNAIKFKTNCHHIVPRCFYKYLKQTIDNSENNLVHLLNKDHMLAHYYLVHCVKDEILDKCYVAFTYIVGKYNLNINELDDLDLYQNLAEKARQISATKHIGKNHNSNTRKKMSASHTGVPRSAYERQCISLGWQKQSEETKRRISEMNSKRCKGRIYINNGQISKMIWPEDFAKYQAQGFVRGNLKSYTDKRVAAAKAALEQQERNMPGMKAKEVMQLLKITRPTLCKYVKQGLIKVDACINGQYRYNEESVMKLLNNKVN